MCAAIRRACGLLGCLLVLVGRSVAQAPLPFSSGWSTNGIAQMSATGGGVVASLTTQVSSNKGSAWYGSPLLVNHFVGSLDFLINTTIAALPADGLCMVLQSVGTQQLGAADGGFGYTGISDSFALCIDTLSGGMPNTMSTSLWSGGSSMIRSFGLTFDVTDSRLYVRVLTSLLACSRNHAAAGPSIAGCPPFRKPHRMRRCCIAREWPHWPPLLSSFSTLQSLSWAYDRTTATFEWNVTGSGLSQSFSYPVGDVPGLVNEPNTASAFVGVSEYSAASFRCAGAGVGG